MRYLQTAVELHVKSMKLLAIFLLIFGVSLPGCAARKFGAPITTCKDCAVHYENLTGPMGIDCGEIHISPFPNKSRLKRESKARVMACVNYAETNQIPFIVTYEAISPPDGYYSGTYIFTEKREKVLYSSGEMGDSGNQMFIGKCKNIYLSNYGSIESQDCQYSQELFELLQKK